MEFQAFEVQICANAETYGVPKAKKNHILWSSCILIVMQI